MGNGDNNRKHTHESRDDKMTDSKMTDLVIKITSELASLNANMKTVLDKLTGHEQRISALEQGKVGLKDNIVKWLVIALIGSIGIIATLTGSAAIIKTMLGIA